MAEDAGGRSPAARTVVVVPLPADPADRALVLDGTGLPGGVPLLERARSAACAVTAPDGAPAEVLLVEPGDLRPVRARLGSGAEVVVLDPLCGLVPADALVVVRARARAGGRCAAAVRPVTDTLKAVHHEDGRVVVDATVDRDACVAVATPVVVPPGAVLAGPVPLGDPAAMLAALRRVADVDLVTVGGGARRVHSAEDAAVLAASLDARPAAAPGDRTGLSPDR